MEEKDRKGFLVLMALLSEAFKEEMSTERAKIYFEFLKQYPLYEVTFAIKRGIRELKFFPKLAELLEFMSPTDSWDRNKEIPFNKKRNEEAIEYIKEIARIIGKPMPRVERLPYKD